MNNKGRGILGRPEATTEEVREAMGEAIDAALREHKRAGVPAATWDHETNRVVLVPPEDIPVPEEAEAVKARG